MYFKLLLVLGAIISNVFCDRSEYSYQLPDAAEQKSLNVTIEVAAEYPFQITIECYDYDSLKYFEVRLGSSTRFELRNGILLMFNKCFNNASNHENYHYELSRWFNSLPYFKNERRNGYPIIIKLDEYAKVNSDVLFKNFDFRKFDTVNFINLGFVSTNFLNHLYCERCLFENSNDIDFNNFSDTIATTISFDLFATKLNNLNRDNLQKFIEIESLEWRTFDLDDYNAFNVPDLFEHNAKLLEIKLIKSLEKITLHEHVFRGLSSLHILRLKELQIDFVPKDLLKNLENLRSVDFTSNNIKSVDPATFQTASQLTYILFVDNPFYTEPHDKLEEFHWGNARIRLDLGNFTEHTFDLLAQLIKHPNVRVTFESYLIDQFNVTIFANLLSSTERNSYVDILFNGGQPTLDLQYIKSFGNILRSQYSIPTSQLNGLIHIQFTDAMCHDCTMVKYLYPYFIDRYRYNPGFYFEESHLFVQLEMPETCFNLNKHFEVGFDENCATNCACKYNSVVDRVTIHCNNQNLLQLPVIPYPSQFDKLHSIYLNVANNSITDVSFANQHVDVVKKLAMLNFKNNSINSVQIDEEVLSKSVWGINLCDNPIVADKGFRDGLRLSLASGSIDLNRFNCATFHNYPEVREYIKQFKSSDLVEYLDGLECNL